MESKKIVAARWCVICAILVLVLGFHLSTDAHAVSANPDPQTLFQADGSAISLFLRGDEFFSWYEDVSGSVVVYDDMTKNWCYAYADGDRLLPSSSVVGSSNAFLSSNLKVNSCDIIDIIESKQEENKLDLKAANGSYTYRNMVQSECVEANSTLPKTNQELLLLMVEFQDSSLKNRGEFWRQRYFEDVKSVSQYYKDMSGGLDVFIPATTSNIGLESIKQSIVRYEGDDERITTLAWVTEGVPVTIQSECDGVIKIKFDMPHPIPEYHEEDNEGNYLQLAIATMAMKAVYENTNYDFNGCDNKPVALIVAGTECSCTSVPDVIGEIWAHTSYVDGNAIGNSTMRVPYIIHGEMYNRTEAVTIGVMCHELGHVLGLPDLYKTGTMKGLGIGYYSLMAYGNWGRLQDAQLRGSTPVALDAWSKYLLGYITPVEYESKIFDTVEIRSAGEIGSSDSSNYNVIKLKNTGLDEKQYFLVDNRQNLGWDAGMQIEFGKNFTGGILFLQIDENIPFDNLINSSDEHRGVNVVGAPKKGAVRRNCFYADGYTRHYISSPDEFDGVEASYPDDSYFYSNNANNPRDNTRDIKSKITVKVNSKCSNAMVIEIGVDCDISSEFTDANFLSQIRTILGKDETEPILKSNLLSITSIKVQNKNIESLAGIEYFRWLKSLRCYGNKLLSLNMSWNPELEFLDCSHNRQLASLNVSKNTKLCELDCNNASLSALDVSHNTKLLYLYCSSNHIESLDLSSNSQLDTLDCCENWLTDLDITSNRNLTYLDCSFNHMSSTEDVRGWQEIGLEIDDTFLFDPQETIN